MHDVSQGLTDLPRTYVRRRYAILFYTLLLTFVCSPLLSTLKRSGVLMELLLAGSLCAAVLPVGAVRRRPVLLVGMVLIWLARPITHWLDQRVFSMVTLGIWTMIGLVAAAAAIHFALHASEIGSEQLYAALSAYLLAGIYFGLLYWVLEQIRPETFNVTGPFSQTSAIYFSFVTLATLGYGDIVPRADIARGLAVVEGVGGQLFLAVLVARLVGLYSRRGNQPS